MIGPARIAANVRLVAATRPITTMNTMARTVSPFVDVTPRKKSPRHPDRGPILTTPIRACVHSLLDGTYPTLAYLNPIRIQDNSARIRAASGQESIRLNLPESASVSPPNADVG